MVTRSHLATKKTSVVGPGQLLDYPVQPWEEFSGYFHKKEQTLLPNNVLTYPTINVFMPDGDKIVPRGGEKNLGQDATQNTPIIGHFKKYQNVAGIEMEMRVWNDPTMTLTSITGTFAVDETITGGSSGATATVNSVAGFVITFTGLVGTFTGGETVTGGTSGAHGTLSVFKGDVIEVLYNGLFQQITPNINTLQKGVSNLKPASDIIYYFDQWIDTNLDPALSINTNRAIFVMGLNKIRSWTGGIATVVGVVANTSISTTTGITWSSLGFPSPTTGGSSTIVINGITINITGGWGTNTLTTTDSTTGIDVGDLAFAGIQEVSAPPNINFDVISSFKNYPCYGDWTLQKFYMGNNFNRDASQLTTNSQAIVNDLSVDNSFYTGTGSHVYRISIDSVNPPVLQQTFTGIGYNDAVFTGSGNQILPLGYTATNGFLNIYKVVAVADTTISVPTSSIAGGPFWNGENIRVGAIGSETATGIVVTTIINGINTEIAVALTTGTFAPTDTIHGVSSGASVTLPGTSTTAPPVFSQTWIQYSKNGVLTSVTSGPLTGFTVPVFLSGSAALNISLTDGLTIQFAHYFGHAVGDVFELDINQGGADTFQWQKDGVAPGGGDTFIPITTTSQAIELGVSVTFKNKTGHGIGDFWEITVDQNIGGNNNNAYANFYYGLPRKPGEGFIGQLPANFWAMKPQEDNMYINDASGKWGYVQTTLSADLLTETIEYVPLKQKGRNKCIFPYMLNYFDNDLVYVTEDKNLDMIGRKALIQLPQIDHLSDPVKYDFIAASFNNGSIEWNGLKLYITSPEDLLMFCYDESVKYWQPPQLIPENGILSEVGSTLISHSNIRNKTNTLFVGTNDNGTPFPIKIRTGYNSYGYRWQQYKASMMFCEGYMKGNPQLTARALLNVNGCAGIIHAPVDPVYCIASDRAPIGYGSFGSHSLGSDVDSPIPYFQWIGTGTSPFQFYMAAMDFECNSLDPIFEILSFGLNTVAAETNNSRLKKGQLKLI